MRFILITLFLFEFSIAQINWSNVYGETHMDEGWFISKVKTLFIGQRSTGSHIVNWDGKNNVGKPVSAGLYFYTLDTPSNRQTKKLILIK